MKHLNEKSKAHPGDVGKAAGELAHEVEAKMNAIPGIVDMSHTDRKTILKMHVGGERYIQLMAKLAQESAKVRPPGVDPAQMTARLSIAADLGQLRATLEHALQRIDDTVLFALGQAWHDALDVYALAQSQSRFDESLASQIAPMQNFLATGPRAAKNLKPTQ
jgi:hypothetical protein